MTQPPSAQYTQKVHSGAHLTGQVKKIQTKLQVHVTPFPLVKFGVMLKINIQVEQGFIGSRGSSEQFKCPDKNRVFFIKREKGEAWKHDS